MKQKYSIEDLKQKLTEAYQESSRDLKRAQMREIGKPVSERRDETNVARGIVMGLGRALAIVEEVQLDNPLPLENKE